MLTRDSSSTPETWSLDATTTLYHRLRLKEEFLSKASSFEIPNSTESKRAEVVEILCRQLQAYKTLRTHASDEYCRKLGPYVRDAILDALQQSIDDTCRGRLLSAARSVGVPLTQTRSAEEQANFDLNNAEASFSTNTPQIYLPLLDHWKSTLRQPIVTVEHEESSSEDDAASSSSSASENETEPNVHPHPRIKRRPIDPAVHSTSWTFGWEHIWCACLHACQPFANSSMGWFTITYPLPFMSLYELQTLLHSSFDPSSPQYGIQDELDTNEIQRALDEENVPTAKRLLLRGISTSLRARVWRLVLGVTEHSPYDLQARSLTDANWCTELKTQSRIMDYLLQHNARQCANDDVYFVFETRVYQLLLLWLRDNFTLGTREPQSTDTEILLTQCNHSHWPHDDLHLTMMPVCFLYDNVLDCYRVYRQLYSRFIYFWQSVNRQPCIGVLPLAKLIETWLIERVPRLYHYLSCLKAQKPQTTELHSGHGGVPVLMRKIVRWLSRGLVQVLDVDQVLMIWDRCIARGDALPLAAAVWAMILIREERLWQCQWQEDIDGSLTDYLHIQIIPVMVHLLYPK